MAVRTDGTAGEAKVIDIYRPRSDLFLVPGNASVAGDRDGQGIRKGMLTLAECTAECNVAQVHIAKKRARSSIVRPDLVFVGAQSGIASSNDHGGIQAELSPAAAAWTLSVRETVAATTPRNAVLV